MSAATFPLRVRLFGRVREEAGIEVATISLGPGSTVADLLESLESELKIALAGSVAVAVNRKYAAADTELAAGDEVAVIPPVAGG